MMVSHNNDEVSFMHYWFNSLTKKSNIYQTISALVCTFPFIVANDASAEVRSVCQEIQRALDARRISKQPDIFVLKTIAREGNDVEYINVDLDEDKKPDSLIQSCGSRSYGSCTLFVSLSSGGSFDFTDSRFFVTRFHAKYYALIGESLSDQKSVKHGKRKLVLLTKNGVKPICKNI